MSLEPGAVSASDAVKGDRIARFLRLELEERLAALRSSLLEMSGPFAHMLGLWQDCVRAGGKILIFGNGGSAADAQHIAAELVVRFCRNRAPIPAIALVSDAAVLTASANDLGFDAIFSRQVEAFGRPGDLALGISTSGRSENVLAALRLARTLGMATGGLTGTPGGAMHDLCDCLLVVPSSTTAVIQEMHLMVGHMLCLALEESLGLIQG